MTAIKRAKARLKRIFYKQPSQRVTQNFKSLSDASQDQLREFLISSYYKNYVVFDASEDLSKDLKDQLSGRLEKFRMEVVPWLASLHELRGARILEVGCGTGSSTVAFSEQGADVTALDVDSSSLEVAEKRMQLHGLTAEYVLGNGQEIDKLFAGRHFDFILFSATLEHMTYTERIGSLKAAHALMKPADHLIVVETPNRLWFYDFHTAFLPFYFWLPDEVAFDYSRRSTRRNFAELYRERTAEQLLHFQRRGRGVSFHDFEIAFEGHTDIRVISCLEIFRKKRWLRFVTDRLKSRGYRRYRKFIQKQAAVHEGFYEPWLDLAFRKD